MPIVIVRANDGLAVASDAGATASEPPSPMQQVYLFDRSAAWGCAGPEKVIERVRQAFEMKDDAEPGWAVGSEHAEDLRQRVAAVVGPALAACGREGTGSLASSVEETTILLAAHLTTGPCAIMLYGNGFSEVLHVEHLATGRGDLAATALMRQLAGTHHTVQQAQVVAWAAVRQAIAWTPQLWEPISLAILELTEQGSKARLVGNHELYEIGATAEFWLETQARALSGVPDADRSGETDQEPPRPPE